MALVPCSILSERQAAQTGRLGPKIHADMGAGGRREAIVDRPHFAGCLLHQSQHAQRSKLTLRAPLVPTLNSAPRGNRYGQRSPFGSDSVMFWPPSGASVQAAHSVGTSIVSPA